MPLSLLKTERTGWGMGGSEEEGSQKVQTSSCKVNKYWARNRQMMTTVNTV